MYDVGEVVVLDAGDPETDGTPVTILVILDDDEYLVCGWSPLYARWAEFVEYGWNMKPREDA